MKPAKRLGEVPVFTCGFHFHINTDWQWCEEKRERKKNPKTKPQNNANCTFACEWRGVSFSLSFSKKKVVRSASLKKQECRINLCVN